MFSNIYFLIVCYVLFVLKCFLFVSVCAFARQFLSVRSMSFVFFLSVWISRCASAISLHSISLLSNIFFVCAFAVFPSFIFYYLFIDWFCVRHVSLLLSLVRLLFYGCVDLSLTFILFGGREAEYDVVPVRELMMITPFPVVASRVWLVGVACLWVLCLILIVCVVYCWHCRVCWCVLFYVYL